LGQSRESVKILLFSTFREKYGVKELVVECNGTIENLITNATKILGKHFLDEIYDKNLRKVKEELIFTINGRDIRDLKEKVKINDGDVIAIFPPSGGG